jgi:flagellar export protein FliJ
MKRFRSSLDAVMTVRQQAEQKAGEKLARALDAREGAAAQLRHVVRNQQQWWVERQQHLAAGCLAGTLQHLSGGDRWFRERREQAEHALRLADTALAEARAGFHAAKRELEAVEKYLANQRARHHALVVREEQKVLDETASRPRSRSWDLNHAKDVSNTA